MVGDQAFLQTIAANPAEDGPRLEYAALCDLYGRTDRAEFIRVQLELARLPELLEVRAVDVRASTGVSGLYIARVMLEEITPDAVSARVRVQAGNVAIYGVVAQIDLMPPDGLRTHPARVHIRREMYPELQRYDDLTRRQAELLNSYHPTGGNETVNSTNETFWASPIRYPERPKFRRGFVEEVTVGWDWWAGVRSPIGITSGMGTPYLAAAPIRRVTLTGTPRVRLSQPRSTRTEEDGMICLRVARDVSVGDQTKEVSRETRVSARSTGILEVAEAQLRDELDKACTLEAWCRRRWPTVKKWAFPTPSHQEMVERHTRAIEQNLTVPRRVFEGGRRG